MTYDLVAEIRLAPPIGGFLEVYPGANTQKLAAQSIATVHSALDECAEFAGTIACQQARSELHAIVISGCGCGCGQRRSSKRQAALIGVVEILEVKCSDIRLYDQIGFGMRSVREFIAKSPDLVLAGAGIEACDPID